MAEEKAPVPPGAAKSDAIAPGAGPAPGSLPAPPGAITAEPMSVAPIPLGAPAAKPTPPATKKEPEPKDTFRELIETIVFVVVLVLMLKTFLAEAFVIPTGSMANTLNGYHHKFKCAKCGREDVINASKEAEEDERGDRIPVKSWTCENCGFENRR
jgi:signal peptidase I